MIRKITGKAQTFIVAGVCALALASIAFQWLHQDFVGGLAFGVGVPLVLIGLSRKRRHQGG